VLGAGEKQLGWRCLDIDPDGDQGPVWIAEPVERERGWKVQWTSVEN
jgi:hypothetical protein